MDLNENNPNTLSLSIDKSNAQNGRSKNDISAFCTLGGRSKEKQQKDISSVIPTYCTIVGGRSRKGVRASLSSSHLNNEPSLLPYDKLLESMTDLQDNDDGGGLSMNLSTESIRNACDCYDDDLSDENMIEVQKTPYNFQKLSSPFRRSLHTATTFDRRHKKRKKPIEHPLCTLSRCCGDGISKKRLPCVQINELENVNNEEKQKKDEEEEEDKQKEINEDLEMSDSNTATHQNDILHVLSELDAILDDQGDGGGGDALTLIESAMTFNDDSGDIENCLLDLDAYLDGIDDSSIGLYDCDNSDQDAAIESLSNKQKSIRRVRTLPKNLRDFCSQIVRNNGSPVLTRTADNLMRRENYLRKTLSTFDLENKKSNVGTGVSSRNDKEGTTTMILPASPITPTTMTATTSLTLNKPWRRNSMRKTSLLVMPDQQRDDVEMATEERTRLKEEKEEPSSMAMTDCNPPVTPTITSLSPVEETNPQNQLPLSRSPLPIGRRELRRCFSQHELPSSSCQEHNRTNRLPNHVEPLTQAGILEGILLENAASCDEHEGNRPRQLGRRFYGHPQIISFDSENNHCTIINHEQRPLSAPIMTTANPRHLNAETVTLPTIEGNVSGGEVGVVAGRFMDSEASSVGSSRNPSPVSLVSSSGSSTTYVSTASTIDQNETASAMNSIEESTESTAQHRHTSHLDPDNLQLTTRPGMNTQWPHSFSRVLALVCCSLGLFNINRFSILTIHYGGNFLLQFLLLSIIFGIPFFWLQMCLGAKIKAGPVSMWKISPICRGIGISLILVHCFLALYSTIGVAWVLVYLRDSFLSKNQVLYPWQEPFFTYRHTAANISGNLTETVADYFNGIVLQRLQLSKRSDPNNVRFQVSDRLAFNLAIVWTVVFLVLCKGLRSFGRYVIGLTIVPLLMLIVITCKLLHVIKFTTVQNIFSPSDFEDFLINSKTWVAAAQESFLTWGLLGPSVIAISSRMHAKDNSKTVLRRDAILVVLITFLGLSLAALFGFACIQIIHNNSYVYIPGSYEHKDTYTAVYSLKTLNNPSLIAFPTKWIPHYSSLVGEIYRRHPLALHRESGYQPLRMVVELFPAAIALSRESISWIWCALTYGMFFLFGVAQLSAMWKPISMALGNSTSSVLLSCVTGLLLGIPLATEVGIAIVHYFDLILGGAWFIPILWTAHILGVFLIRGRPYNGDVLVNDLRMNGSMSAFLALSWNVFLPIGMIALSVIEYKVSLSSQFFHWRGKSYYSFWARKVAGLTQVGFLLLVPITAIIQIYRYLSSGPSDILERIQLLYRPPQSPPSHRRNRSNLNGEGPRLGGHPNSAGARISSLDARTLQDDAPPKYTPPPSYTTATGARLAKILRHSIRRSVRRILGEPGRSRPILPIDTGANEDNSLPPDYSTVLSNPSGTSNLDPELAQEINPNGPPSMLFNSYTQRTLSLGRDIHSLKHSTQNFSGAASDHAGATLARSSAQPPYTANDVATILRASNRGGRRNEFATSAVRFSLRNKTSADSQNLVANAAPLGESLAVVSIISPPPQQDEITNNTNTSVI